MDMGRSELKPEQGVSANNSFKDLSSSRKIPLDHYTHEELHPFKWDKKNKSLRREEELDIIAFEAKVDCAGLCLEDLGSQKDGRKQGIREEQQKSEFKKKSNAYQSAYAKADETSKALRLENVVTIEQGGEENLFFSYDDQAAFFATTSASSQTGEDQNPTFGGPQDNRIVLTEMEERVWGLQLDEEHRKSNNEDVFMEEDDAPKASDQKVKDEAGCWTEVKDTGKHEFIPKKDKEEIVLDEIVHEVPLGKGLSGELKLLKHRGTLKETVEGGGRNMDKKKKKPVGISGNGGLEEIRIERTDEFTRTMTPKEDFQNKYHGEWPGKIRLAKLREKTREELKLKEMKNLDTPSLSSKILREALKSKMSYIVTSPHVRPGYAFSSFPDFAFLFNERSDVYGVFDK